MNKPNSPVNESRTDALVRKWSKVLDYSSNAVPEIRDEHTYRTTAMLLENQEKWCMESNNSSGIFGATVGATGGSVGNTDSYAPGDNRLPKILIPMIRRTFPELLSNELVGVQPMGGPVGLAFALRYAYQGETLGADGIDGRSFSTSNRANGSSGYTGTNGISASPYGSELGYQLLDTRFTGTSAGALSGNSEWTFADQDRGVAELLQNYELTGKIPQIEMKFEKTAVEAGTRRLATRWSVELEQDLKNIQGIDIDGELTNAMSYEIQAEIDREVVIRMIQAAMNGGAGAGYSLWSPVSADGRWTAERNITFYQKLLIEAGRMAARNRRGAANFIVATPRVCTILEMLPDFKTFEITGNVSTAGVGIAKVGTVGSRFTVYRDTRTEVQNQSLYNTNGSNPYTPTRNTAVEYALLGYKGSEYYDTGIIYCPYIPIMVQRTIGPNDFAPRVGLMTRYGIVNNIFGANLYYHLIIVKNLGDAFTPGTVSTYL